MVNQDYLKVLTRFVLLYRQCLNEVGWQRRREYFLKCNMSLEKDEVYVSVLSKEGKSLHGGGQSGSHGVAEGNDGERRQ